MTVIPFPTREIDPQRVAADPELSAFVTANAGSGKTKTLIDRVARLLLAGAEPATILCVTYTKAAAAEMQRRLFGLLGDWSVCDDTRLRQALSDLEGRPIGDYDPLRLSAARALFARALETPGGLKIQTIHAFCEKLLRRFPLEAGVSPGFRVMDDAASAAIADAARKAVARLALKGEGSVPEAYARFSVALDFQSFQAMFGAFENARGRLGAYFEKHGGLAGAVDDVWEVCCGSPEPIDLETLERDAVAALNLRTWREAAVVLAEGGKADAKNAAALRAVTVEPTFASALACMFTERGEGTPATWVAKTSGLKAHEPLRSGLLADQEALEEARAFRRAAQVAVDTHGALTLAAAYLEAYRIEKASYGALDFSDLIEKTRDLVAESPAAAWVLYKLDGGIDHILVDEAQDTAPDQWAIVRSLAGEFFSGAGVPTATRLERNMFVVGDEKQSIYSFQGARPELLMEQFEFHRDRATGAGFRFEKVDLLDSWRSTPQVLTFVDATFSSPELATAILPRALPEPITHKARRVDHAGCVDIWPLEREEKGDVREAWDAPLDQETEASANKRLAARIACEIGDLLARGDGVFDKGLGERGEWRPARPGDVLILVRRRKALFEEILRALKHAKIPVAGADRLALSEHIVFDDLVAVARFALFPADDLTLAALLRSPFCDLTDDSLYALARNRAPPSLWQALTARAEERPEWREAHDLLTRLLEEARERRPFEFYSRLLGARDAAGRSMRQRLLRRLGGEAEDALDEFLAQVLAAESRGTQDLESLTAAFASLDITVKREMEAGRDEVRVMTAHGAKGLEAPIVFLPETTLSRGARGTPLLETADGGFLWCASAKGDCEASATARERRAAREEDEAYRLLYVALTRARDRLVLCGRVAANAKEENLKGWWGALTAAFDHAEVSPHKRATTCGALQILRFGPDPVALGKAADSAATATTAPAWTRAQAIAEPHARYASPSQLGEDAATPAASPLAVVAGLGRFRRGDLIHRLLQILPDLALEARPAAALRLLARERDLTDAQRAEMTSAALGVLNDPRFAEVFGPGSRAEVALAGTASRLPAGLAISGRIDRLVVLHDRVLVADFKTNRPSPDRIEDADPAYLRQMAIYAAVLAEVFPGRAIEAALVWTDGPKLMAVPEILISQTLAELGRAG
ncbi:MAG: double-strand break repair helicase AddA [Phenylobacterium sp.]|uniref:double-strand break repair helicase AddA n=1 Tax=Phenylobacterium sp. TaxID=1871053 RepID=UPI00273086D9|nr:double-strand break repair helicase AddA [Phenylobacterium sp.]MDP2010981.1 double-strand break repair helicase AddA [Phenylobacterium sp.]